MFSSLTLDGVLAINRNSKLANISNSGGDNLAI